MWSSMPTHPATCSTWTERKNGSTDPRPITPDATPHPLLDGLYHPREVPEVSDEYGIDRLVAIRKTHGAYDRKFRWFDYSAKDDDTWEPIYNLPCNLVIRFLRQKKMAIPGYEWRKPAPNTRRTVRNAPSTVACVTSTPNWVPKAESAFSNYRGEIWVALIWSLGNRMPKI